MDSKIISLNDLKQIISDTKSWYVALDSEDLVFFESPESNTFVMKAETDCTSKNRVPRLVNAVLTSFQETETDYQAELGLLFVLHVPERYPLLTSEIVHLHKMVEYFRSKKEECYVNFGLALSSEESIALEVAIKQVPYKFGDEIIVMKGHFKGVSGTIISMKECDLVSVCINKESDSDFAIVTDFHKSDIGLFKVLDASGQSSL